MIVHQAYLFALDPTPAQARALSAHRGAARFALRPGQPRAGACQLVRLPRTGKLARRIDAGTARVLSATVRYEGSRWFCSFACECGPDRRTGRRPSQRWERANQRRNRIHHRVAYLRRDGVHKLTRALANEFGSIVVEDLKVAGMQRNRRLARAIADTGFAEIRRQLAYNTRWRGSCLVVADRWYPSSKTCSDCGVVKAKLPLHVRVFCCDSCGLRVDRDRNAARNLASLVARSTTGTGDLEPQGSNGRGAAGSPTTCGLVAMKRSPRAEQSDQTRTSRAGPFVTTA